jgi:peptide subunit release factor 1 (eRF1)
MDLRDRLIRLAKIERAETPVVSVYLNTRWADEHQRDRVRVFLKNELAKARRAPSERAAEADLDWIETEGEALVAQARFPDAHGVALFACQALGLRELLPVRAPFADRFVVADTAFLRPVAETLKESPPALIVFVDTESARLIPVTIAGAGDEVVVESEVPGRHSRGGWAQMAQSRYQRHIQDHRARHFEVVVESLGDLTERHRVERIVLAGEGKNVALFRQILPPRLANLVAGAVAGARHEAGDVIVGRAAELVGHLDRQEQGDALDAVLTEGAKGGQAVASFEETLDAVNRGAVHRLYLLRAFGEAGRLCLRCTALQRGPDLTCRLCGGEAKPVELADAMVDRVIACGGEVETVDAHEALAHVGGVAARLRYPL